MIKTIAQIIGFCGMAVVALSFQCKRNKQMHLLQFFSSALFALSFLLTGALTGMLMNIGNLLRQVVMYNKGKKWADHPAVLGLLLAAFTALCVPGFRFPISALPLLASYVSLVTMWSDKWRLIRQAQLLVVSPIWIYYSFAGGSTPLWFNMAADAINMVSVILALARHRRARR